jgi:hypothetical protein
MAVGICESLSLTRWLTSFHVQRITGDLVFVYKFIYVSTDYLIWRLWYFSICTRRLTAGIAKGANTAPIILPVNLVYSARLRLPEPIALPEDSFVIT